MSAATFMIYFTSIMDRRSKTKLRTNALEREVRRHSARHPTSAIFFSPTEVFCFHHPRFKQARNGVTGLTKESSTMKTACWAALSARAEHFLLRGDNVLLHSPPTSGFTHSPWRTTADIVHSPR